MKNRSTIIAGLALLSGAFLSAEKLSAQAGNTNTSEGHDAGISITTGAFNSFFGHSAGKGTSNGHSNTFMGFFSGKSNTSGYRNTFIGHRSGEANLIGFRNTFVGDNSGIRVTTGYNNVFMGAYSGLYHTTGQSNTYIGSFAGYRTDGDFNVYLGSSAGGSSENVTSNCYIGYAAGATNANGSHNVLLGYKVGLRSTGNRNVFLGSEAGANFPGDDQFVLSSRGSLMMYGDFANNQLAVNTAWLGVGHTFYVNGDAGGTSFWLNSDKRFKKDIRNIGSAVSKLSKINGVSYAFKKEEFEDYNFPEGRTYGVLAQEVKALFPELVSEGDNGLYMVNYDGLIPVLIEAVKEQQQAIVSLQEEVHSLKDDSSKKSGGQLKEEATSDTPVYLEQNKPNPFTESTEITYRLPEGSKEGMLYIYDMQGTQLKKIPLTEQGTSSIRLQAGEWKPGLYTYAMVVQGEILATRKMLITD